MKGRGTPRSRVSLGTTISIWPWLIMTYIHSKNIYKEEKYMFCDFITMIMPMFNTIINYTRFWRLLILIKLVLMKWSWSIVLL